jgi:hypothetical protein
MSFLVTPCLDVNLRLLLLLLSSSSSSSLLLLLLKCIPNWIYKLVVTLCPLSYNGWLSLKAAIPDTDYDRSSTTRDCGMFQLFAKTDDARCTRDVESRIAMAETAFNKTKSLSYSKLNVKLRKKLVKWYIWSIASYVAETWTLRKLDQKYLESFETKCWEKIDNSWTDRVRKVLQRVRRRGILYI